MPRARYPAFTFLWLLATTGAFGKVKLILPDHIIVEQPTLIPWSRAGEGTVINYGMRTVPPIEFQAGAFQIDSVAGLSGTVTIVFHESPTGFVALEVFDKNNVSTVHGNSTAFKIFNADGSTGSQGTTTSTSSSSADSPGAASTETPSGPSSIHHVAARVIAGAVFGSLTLLGLLAGILLWLRRRKWALDGSFLFNNREQSNSE
ncbi:hypothetical protein C8J56DRAFT_210915 [Mycena floridula]|nr:hypothetical protein C8J56DRAFT_210915 [Mycena floridula]